MRRRLTVALGALALGWQVCPAPAAEPVNDAGGVALAAPATPLPAVAASPTVMVPGPADPAGDNGGYGHFFAGAGVYIMKPYIEKDRAWAKTTGLPGTQGDFVSEQYTDFSYDFEGAPRVWVGWVSDAGWGARARYFHFDATGHAPPGTLSSSEDRGTSDLSDDGFLLESARPGGIYALDQATTTLDPGQRIHGPGTDVLSVSSKLDLDVWDLEAIDEIRTCGWLFTVGGGLRHADLVHFYDATRRNTLDTAGLDVRSLHSSHRFIGTGPLLSLDVRYAIGDFGLALFGNARGACLFGDRTQFAYARSSGLVFHDFAGGARGEIFGGDLGHSNLQKNDVVPVTEVEVGVEWSRTMGGVRPFIQVGVVGQSWFNALSNNSPLNEGDNAPPTPVTVNGLLGLFGVDISAGVSF